MLDANGTIITVNRAWLGSKSPGGFLAEPAGAGENYLVLCERAIDNGNQEAEREWRFLRLEALLFLRAHGGSETIDEDELGRRIGNELEAVRA